ncbi:MAG: hypothetical protein WC849_03595 [Candidatus Paceibacterota bacterium]
MTLEFSNTREQPPSIYDQVMDTIDEIIQRFESGDKQEYLTSNLSVIYGAEFAKEIVGALPAEFFIENEAEEKESLISPTESGTTKILSEIVNLPEDKKENKILEILEKEYHVPEEKIEKFKISRNWKIFFEIGMTVIPIIIATLLIKNKEKPKEIDKKLDKKEITFEKKEEKKETSINFNERFDVEIYNSLPKKGQEIYKCFAENDPTPGNSYQILDKDTALIYVFDYRNKIIAKFPAGFGKDEGDEPNTSIEYNKGKNTTPAGIYLLSNFALPSDIKEYGELQFSLYGISILGDRVFLGEHQTYSGHGELERRTKRLNSKTEKDNNFTDGCLNADKENIKNFVKPYFKGDYSEFLFVLPDKKSRESGVVFNVNVLIEEIIPVMLEMVTKEEKVYEEYTIQVRDSINKFVEEIAILKNKYNNLVKEYKEDNKNTEKQIKTENIKKEMSQKKKTIGEGRKTLSELDKKTKELNIKRQNIEKMVMREN